jgi:hypothetical protein
MLLIGESMAQNFVGIILQGNDKGCTITHKGESRPCSTRHLFLGDIIEQKTSLTDLKIKWAPNVSGKEIDKTHLEVILTKQQALKSAEYINKVGEFVKNFIKPAEHLSISASARSFTPQAICETVMRERIENLPSRGTLMMDIPIVLSWQNSNIDTLIITDARAEKVFEKNVRNQGELSFSAAEARLNRGETYFWRFDDWDSTERHELSVLSKQLEYEILDGLAKIDTEEGVAYEKMIRKAAFLQMISDTYPDMIDLYWLSLQLLPEISVNDHEAKTVCGLKLRYIRHFSE